MTDKHVERSLVVLAEWEKGDLLASFPDADRRRQLLLWALKRAPTFKLPEKQMQVEKFMIWIVKLHDSVGKPLVYLSLSCACIAGIHWGPVRFEVHKGSKFITGARVEPDGWLDIPESFGLTAEQLTSGVWVMRQCWSCDACRLNCDETDNGFGIVKRWGPIKFELPEKQAISGN